MNKLLLSLFVALAIQLPCFAAEPSNASLERLMAVTHPENMVQSMRQQTSKMMAPIFEKALDTRNMTAQQRQEAERFFASFQKKFNVIMDEELSWDRLKGIQMQIYRETFTQDEINGLIAFYESPTGQAFVKKMPMVMQKSMLMMQQRMAPMAERIRQAAEETAQEFRNRKPAAK